MLPGPYRCPSCCGASCHRWHPVSEVHPHSPRRPAPGPARGSAARLAGFSVPGPVPALPRPQQHHPAATLPCCGRYQPGRTQEGGAASSDDRAIPSRSPAALGWPAVGPTVLSRKRCLSCLRQTQNQQPQWAPCHYRSTASGRGPGKAPAGAQSRGLQGAEKGLRVYQGQVPSQWPRLSTRVSSG